jgi:hypothetical protein
MRVYSPDELNKMSVEERRAHLGGEFGRMFREMAHRHVTWLFWARETTGLTDILGHGSAFILDRGLGPMLVTAAHVYRHYLAHREEHGPLYCQVANTRVNDLSRLLIACGNLSLPLCEPDLEPDIATFKMNPAAAERVGKVPVRADGDWPPPPAVNQQVMFGGYPGQERIFVNESTINFGFHSGMTGATAITDRQITARIERDSLVDNTGNGLPPPGYGLGGISGAPLLVPEFRDNAWYFRLGGVISQATDERPAEEVLFEMIVAHRAEFIQPDGRLARIL